MSFDPITMALCKGASTVGDTTLPIVNITTIIPFGGEPVTLTADENSALSNAYITHKLPIIFFRLDSEEMVFQSVATRVGAEAFVCSFFLGTEAMSFWFTVDYNGGNYLWSAYCEGGTLNPLE